MSMEFKCAILRKNCPCRGSYGIISAGSVPRCSSKDMAHEYEEADVAVFFRPLPRIPLVILFWDQEKEEDFEARVKLMFDETIVGHLDLESIIFLSERLRELLCEY